MTQIGEFCEWLYDNGIVLTKLSGIEKGEVNMLQLALSSCYELETQFLKGTTMNEPDLTAVNENSLETTLIGVCKKCGGAVVWMNTFWAHAYTLPSLCEQGIVYNQETSRYDWDKADE